MKTKKTKLSVNVTAHDIKTGSVGNGYNCPVQKGIRRATYYKKFVSVGSDTAVIGNVCGIELPQKAKTLINRFDQKLSVKPISFILIY
jgi:hypothetical protein